MKKIFLLATTILCLATAGLCYSAEGENDPERPPQPSYEEINIEKVGGGGIQRPRTMLEPLEAYIDRSASQLVIYFNLMFGDVTVTVTDANGAVVSSYDCDTDAEEVLYIPAPAEAGDYTLDIEGAQLTATGVFSIQ